MTEKAVSLQELTALPAARRREVERRLVGPLFDAVFYLESYAEVMKRDGLSDPLDHFLGAGWTQLLKPHAGFDTWWYWVTHLDPGTETINPAVHYAVVGHAAGLPIGPGRIRQEDGVRLDPSHPVRRAILFAGFDAESVVDDVVVLMVAELARWGDVFYLADNWLPEHELDKLRPHTRGAWAVRHASYDFGSYAMLARDLVGWERLEEYDEVLFVNDSTFLLRPLDEVFTTMADRDCAWWGLQATKGLVSTAHQPTTSFTEPIAVDRVRNELLDLWEQDPEYDFHVGSYFLAFRRPVLNDPIFRKLVDSIHPQRSKRNVVMKYEVGLTHVLLGRSHRFDTLVPAVHPLHPLFTATHFTLIARGFPLLKRYLLAQNHYHVPDLGDWKERVLELVPTAPVDLFEAALVRTTPADRLAQSLSVPADASGVGKRPALVRSGAFRRMDAKRAKDPAVWVFAADPRTGRLPPSLRAVLHHVADDDTLTKVVLTRGRRLDLRGTNLVTVPVIDPRSRDELYRAGVIFTGTPPQSAVRAPISVDRHVIVGLRDGFTLTPTGGMTAKAVDPTELEHPQPDEPTVWLHEFADAPLTGFATSSDADQILAANHHSPALYGRGWRTGIPAHDFLTMPVDSLPDELQEEYLRLRAEAAGRRIVLLIPEEAISPGEAAERYSAAFVSGLRSLLIRHDAVLAIREPYGDLHRGHTALLADKVDAIDASFLRYGSTNAVLRAADLVWTDVHGAALDVTVRGTAVVSHRPAGQATEPTVYDLDHLFPGPVTHDAESLLTHLDAALDAHGEVPTPRYERFRDLFLDFRDDRSAERVVERTRAATREGSA
ncbi:rhamnan synthesis F family protein [Nocardioides sp. Kera G14]|uniref:rhamnan synthesis F family protein n=1 Tax=Nocardioides sp. Kera G14 TaxID=2884264 RepID=UPI001D128D74|nr:rhamnan synthesis F family protein [Nocardioides sp. Kera G14]UDY22659.1 CDP-glycerol glycerophosphotransferase family protein [Nocardioides sp. Kera G14]